jgi:anti-sigma regulatory factor (Ser/Thr protein kinase)
MKNVLLNKKVFIVLLAVTVALCVFYVALVARPISYGMGYTNETVYEGGVFKGTMTFYPDTRMANTNTNLDEVMEYVNMNLEAADVSMKAQMQIAVAVEEIFVNICKYAYHPDKGRAVVRVEVVEDPVQVKITFVDHGKPYDPLLKDDPDVTLSAEEREIGGLGIFMVKQSMDAVEYEYKDGSNILTLVKNL